MGRVLPYLEILKRVSMTGEMFVTGLIVPSELIESSYLSIWDMFYHILTFPSVSQRLVNCFYQFTGHSQLIESSYLSIWDVFYHILRFSSVSQ